MFAKKIDTNQNDIVSKLRKIGCSVAITSMIGKGFPDIVVGRAGINYLFEIKNGKKAPSQKRLTQDELKFFENWRGQVNIIENFEDALKIMGVLE